MTKHPEMTHSSSFLGCIKPIGLRFFKVAFCDLEACSSVEIWNRPHFNSI